MIQFIDSEGRAHETPLKYLAEYGTTYDALDYESRTVNTDDQHKCYRPLSSRRKTPNFKRAQKIFLKKKRAYTAAATPVNEQDIDAIDEAAEISCYKSN